MSARRALRPPSPAGLLLEGFGALEVPRLLWRLPALAREPRGDGGPVLVLPGYGSGDVSTALLQTYLRRLGWAARGAGLGRNHGDLASLLPRVIREVARAADVAGRPVRLVGAGLGGTLARDAARERPDVVDRVVTFGSPLVGGARYTAAARAVRRRGFDLDTSDAPRAARARTPLRVPSTAIYSRRDGVVAWRACIDPNDEATEYVAVRTTHIGLGFSPEVYRIVARRLAARSVGDPPPTEVQIARRR